MNDREKNAFKRLGKWSDPSAAGSPSKRMVQIWPNPILMAQDIHVLLELVHRHTGAKTDGNVIN